MKINCIQNFSKINFAKAKAQKTSTPIKTQAQQDNLDMSFINIKNAPNFKEGMAILNDTFGDEFLDVDKRIFLTKFCKASDGSIDLDVTSMFSTFVSLFGLSTLREIINAHDILLDENQNFDIDKAFFILDGCAKMSNYFSQNDPSSIALMRSNSFLANSSIFNSLSTIADSNKKEDGTIDTKKAMQSLDDWLNYITANKANLNSEIMTIIQNNEGDLEVVSIDDVIKKYPKYKEVYDNDLYRIFGILNYNSEGPLN